MKSYWQHLVRKYISIVIIISVCLLMISTTFVVVIKSKYSLAEVGSIRLNNTTKKEEQTTITIMGTHTCDNKVHSHELNIDMNMREVNIKLWKKKGSYGPCPAIYPLLFIYNIDITFPFNGTWIIKCNNKNISVMVYS